jgi:hypothetical protein
MFAEMLILNLNSNVMRKIIFFTLLFLISASSFSQQKNPERPSIQQDYLKKSEKQKKVGLILLLGGAGLITTSVVIPRGELVYDGTCIGGLCDDKYKNDGIKSAFFIAGSISALSSIPLFIVSGKNRRKATSVSFKIEKTAHLYNQNFVYTSFPALRVKVNF